MANKRKAPLPLPFTTEPDGSPERSFKKAHGCEDFEIRIRRLQLLGLTWVFLPESRKRTKFHTLTLQRKYDHSPPELDNNVNTRGPDIKLEVLQNAMADINKKYKHSNLTVQFTVLSKASLFNITSEQA